MQRRRGPSGDDDALRVSQIFTNILTNALKYTESGGRITVLLSQEALADTVISTLLVS